MWSKIRSRYNPQREGGPKGEGGIWSEELIHRVVIDDTDVTGIIGVNGYAYYDISETGAVLVVRPDGYAWAITPLDRVDEMDQYFAASMTIW